MISKKKVLDTIYYVWLGSVIGDIFYTILSGSDEISLISMLVYSLTLGVLFLLIRNAS